MPTYTTPAANLTPPSSNYASREEERFKSFYRNILNLHDLIGRVDNVTLRRQLRELINKIEAVLEILINTYKKQSTISSILSQFFYDDIPYFCIDDFVGDVDFTSPCSAPYNTIRVGIIGGSLSGKSSLIQHFVTGTIPKDEMPPAKHKKVVDIQGINQLMLLRDETGPDTQFSNWADVVILVFNMTEELSFNILSGCYSKMLQQRQERDLPCILVAIQDDITMDNSASIAESRIKKFISEHRKCPFFVVNIETGENVQEVFYAAAEKMLQSENQRRVYNYDGLLSSASSMNALDSVPSNTTLSTSGGSPVTQKKSKRRNTLFSMKHEKRDDFVRDDIGSGRIIPVKQGHLYKKSHISIKEWKKKYVVITTDQKFIYYPSMKDYMEDNNAKFIHLIHASVKTSFKKGVIPINQGIQTKTTKSNSVHNLSCTSPTRTIPDSKQPSDCFVISNNSAADSPKLSNRSHLDLANGSPTINQSYVERSASDVKDYSPSPSIRNAQSYDDFPTKRKSKKHASRYKSCEIDYQLKKDNKDNTNTNTNNINSSNNNNKDNLNSGRENGNEVCEADVDGLLFLPSTPVLKKKSSHRRNRSNVSLKDVSEGRMSDTESEDDAFSIIYYDGKTWDFECQSPEDRDVWVKAIEDQIMKAFQARPTSPLSEKESTPTSPNGTSVLEQLISVAGNDKCADCDSPNPEWASLNLGILICIECSGVHRNLGSHLSRVRSILLDDWPSEVMAVMLSLGNAYANSVWQSDTHGKRKLSFNSTREDRERWIFSKYDKKEMVQPPQTNSISQDLIDCVTEENVRGCYSLLIHSDQKDINRLIMVNNEKLSPLHLSCHKANIPITQLLLWYHADPRIVDERGYNPIFYANKSNSKDCADLLYQYGCPEDTPC